MSEIRINQLPLKGKPAPIDLLLLYDRLAEEGQEDKAITVSSLTRALEERIIDQITVDAKVEVESESVSLNTEGISTINFTGPGVQASLREGDNSYVDVQVRQKVVTNLLYVAEDGDDSKDGLTLDNAKSSIRSALREAGRFYTYSDLPEAPNAPDKSSLESKPQRYYNLLKDAGNSIGANKDFIIEECWAYAVSKINNPNFTNFPEKGKRDLGFILDSIVADLKNGGNLSTVRAGQAFFNKLGELDYIENILEETKVALGYLKNLMIAAMRNWDWEAVCEIEAGGLVKVNTDLGVIGFIEGATVTSEDILIPEGTKISGIVGNRLELTNTLLTSTEPIILKFELLEGYYQELEDPVQNPDLIPDVYSCSSEENCFWEGGTSILSECSGVAHALVTYTSILESIWENGKDTVNIKLPSEGFTVFVKAGSYLESNPLEIPANSSVIGDNLRVVTVLPENLDKDLFHVNNGSYIAGMSFRTPGNAAFPNSIATYPSSGAGQIYESPYIQNCTNFCPESTGLKIDGSKALGLRSMVLDAFTQFNPGGIGCHVLNQGYTQLVSMFTICSDKSVLAESGGTVSLTNSNSDFGNFGLFSEGRVPFRDYTAFEDYESNSFTFYLRGADIGNFPPYVGLVCEPIEPHYSISEARIDTSYDIPTTISIPEPLGRNGIPAEISTTLLEGEVIGVNIISGGSQYTETQVTEVYDNSLGVYRKALNLDVEGVTLFVEPTLYTVKSVERVSLNTPTFKVVFEENFPFPIQDGEVFRFYQPSFIVSSSHTFEFIGGGTDILSALPQNGAEFFPDNETVPLNGGRVAATSSDQVGNFKIGEGISINNSRGEIEGEAFERSIFNIMSPIIIALG